MTALAARAPRARAGVRGAGAGAGAASADRLHSRRATRLLRQNSTWNRKKAIYWPRS
jgi:hypothetical protein